LNEESGNYSSGWRHFPTAFHAESSAGSAVKQILYGANAMSNTSTNEQSLDISGLSRLVGELEALPPFCMKDAFYRDFPDHFGPFIPKNPAEAEKILEAFVMTHVASRFALSHREADLFFVTALSYHEICEEDPSKIAVMRELWEPMLQDLWLLKAAG
jgi:hypothetical protein